MGDVGVVAHRTVPQPLGNVAHVGLDDPHPLRGRRVRDDRDDPQLVEHLEKGASFEILKGRKGVFRNWDHQLLQEMYVVRVRDKSAMKDKWDIFEVVQTVPGSSESLELIQPTQAENPCTMA